MLICGPGTEIEALTVARWGGGGDPGCLRMAGSRLDASTWNIMYVMMSPVSSRVLRVSISTQDPGSRESCMHGHP